jgi:uncharacterized protein (DUF1778 family)
MKERRTASIIFRVTPEEKEAIEEAAELDQRSVGDFARVATFERIEDQHRSKEHEPEKN